jgi:hypothetical protein
MLLCLIMFGRQTDVESVSNGVYGIEQLRIGCHFLAPRKLVHSEMLALRRMKFFSPQCPPVAGRWFAAACVVLLSPLVVGCASPGPPRAPSLRLPQQVKDLTAERVGDEVELHWTTPAKTTDDLPIKGPLTAEICRTLASATPPPTSSPTKPACTPVKRIPVQPGTSQTADTLPRPLTLDPVALLAYRVQILNANQRSAGQSLEAFAAAGAAPPPVEDLRATPVRAGAMIEWRPQPTTAPVELDRQLEGVPTPIRTTPPKPASKPKSKPSPKPTTKSSPKPKQPPPSPATEAKLKAPQQATDPGGTIDRTAQFGETYRYTAQRVRAAVIPGHTLDLRSAASQPVVVLLKDTFPPQPPTGLAAVPGGATPAEASIDLSWEPDTDADLAGYIIYRQPLDATGAFTGPAIRLNATPVPSPAYSDRTAVPGQSYAYRVTAVDTVGNESAPGADIQEKLTQQ